MRGQGLAASFPCPLELAGVAIAPAFEDLRRGRRGTGYNGARSTGADPRSRCAASQIAAIAMQHRLVEIGMRDAAGMSGLLRPALASRIERIALAGLSDEPQRQGAVG